MLILTPKYKPRILVAIAIAIFAAVRIVAHTQAVTDQAAMPSDPKELLKLAATENGLLGAEIKPWHLKATVQEFDKDGKVKDQVSVEEFWAGPRKSRVTYTVDGLAKNIYTTENGLLRSGSTDPLHQLVEQAADDFVQPMPPVDFFEHQEFLKKAHKAGGGKVQCLEAKQPAWHGPIPAPVPLAYCLSEDMPILRIAVIADGTLEIVRNKIVRFQGRYVPQEVSLTRSEKPSVTARLDSLESLKTIDEADFTPPADAVSVNRQVDIPSGVATGMILKKVAPSYPNWAKQNRVSGTVVMSARIDKDGHVVDLEVVSGPPELRQAAVDAVKQWLYRPYLLNGEPVEVRTQVNVIFAIGF